MNNSGNTTISEPTIPILKSVFQRGTNPGNFDVSYTESSLELTNHKKSDVTLDGTVTVKEKMPFKRPRQLLHDNFNVNFDESNIISDPETTMTIAKPKQPFKHRKKPAVDLFDVSYNESVTNVNVENDDGDDDDDENDSIFVTKKNNLFKNRKTGQTNTNYIVDFENTYNENTDGDFDISKVSSKQSVFKRVTKSSVSLSTNTQDMNITNSSPKKLSQEDDDDDISVVASQKNPFKRPAEKPIKNIYEMGFEESTLGDDSETTVGDKHLFKKPNRSSQKFEVSYNTSTVTFQEKMSSSNQSFSIGMGNEPLEKQNFEKDQLAEVDSQHQESLMDQNNMMGESMIEKETSVSESKTESNIQDSMLKESTSEESTTEKENVTEKPAEKEETEESILERQQATQESVYEKENMEEKSIQKSSKEGNNISATFELQKNQSSEMTLDQSSIGNDNVDNWMSFHSVESSQLESSKLPEVVPPPELNKMPRKETNECNLIIWEQKAEDIVSQAKRKTQVLNSKTLPFETISKPKKKSIPVSKKPVAEKLEKKEDTYKPMQFKRPARFATKRLYDYIIKKLKPKYGIDTFVEAENLVLSICDTVKKVDRRKNHQKNLIQSLKKEMATKGVIETTIEFYEFIIEFLPYSFRIKTVPCVQTVTNDIFPPRDTTNPFDKIL